MMTIVGFSVKMVIEKNEKKEVNESPKQFVPYLGKSFAEDSTCDYKIMNE